ncbi:hypothetical protein HZU67_04607 [Apis mellifera carnica]|nr:hypothetical protein HZU67_04607 [Apis mellifera carnica]
MGRGAINRARNKQCQHRSPLLHLADKIATPRKAKDEEEEEGGGEACRIYLQPRRRDILTANFGQPLSTLIEMGCKIDPRLTASRPKRLSYRVLTKRRSGVGIWGWIDRAGEGEIEKIDR